MTAALPVTSRRPAVRGVAIVAFGLLFSVGAAGCSSSPPTIPTEVARQLDVPNNAIADLTSPGDEEVPRLALMQAAVTAQPLGTRLRFVVAASDGRLVSAESVVKRYGGTVISYKANDTAFEAASRDMSGSQLDRALSAAGAQADMGSSAAAFVEVLEDEGLQQPGISFSRVLLLLALVVAAIFMVMQAYSYAKARKRRIKRQRVFTERQAVLKDWAEQLVPHVETLTTRAAEADDAAMLTVRESHEFVTSIVPKIEAATTLGELDAAEMRIGRVAIKLRDLRRTLDA